MNRSQEDITKYTAHLLDRHASGDYASLIADIKWIAEDPEAAAYVGHALACVVRCHSWSGFGVIEYPELGLSEQDVLAAGRYACAVVDQDLATAEAFAAEWESRNLPPSWHHHMIVTVIHTLTTMAAHSVKENPNGHG